MKRNFCQLFDPSTDAGTKGLRRGDVIITANNRPVASQAELDAQVVRIGARLQAMGVRKGAKVAVHLERSVDLVAAIVAVLRSGAVFVPIDPSYPRLAGQYRDYLAQAMFEYKREGRKNAIMGAQAKLLSKQDIENLSAYFASQKSALAAKY